MRLTKFHKQILHAWSIISRYNIYVGIEATIMYGVHAWETMDCPIQKRLAKLPWEYYYTAWLPEGIFVL